MGLRCVAVQLDINTAYAQQILLVTPFLHNRQHRHARYLGGCFERIQEADSDVSMRLLAACTVSYSCATLALYAALLRLSIVMNLGCLGCICSWHCLVDARAWRWPCDHERLTWSQA